jgi:hypothetical protein
VKLTVTVRAAEVNLTVHVMPETVSHPVHPVKMENSTGVAVSVTTVPLLKSAEQVFPQLIPAGFEVTVPPSRPVFVTVNGTRTVNGVALTPVPLDVVTLTVPLVAPAGTVA